MSMVTGDTVDISIFRFPWFAPVWFYHPRVNFPVDKMLPGYFLGIKDNVGDTFSFYIVSTGQVNRPRPRVDVRSVVRLRDPQDDTECAPTAEYNSISKSFSFYRLDSEGKRKDLGGDIELEEAPSSQIVTSPPDVGTPESVSIYGDTSSSLGSPPTHSSSSPPSNNITHTSTVADTVPPSLSTLIEETTDTSTPPIPPSTPDKSPDTTLPSNPPIITQEDDDNSTIATEMSYDSEEESINEDINNHFAIDSDDWDTLDLRAIIGYRTTSKGILEFEVEFMDKATTFYPYSVMKTDHPKALADFILANQNDLQNPSLARWARWFKRNLRRTIRRILRYYGLRSPGSIYSSRSCGSKMNQGQRSLLLSGKQTAKSIRRAKKPGRNNCKSKPKFHYGIEIPNNYAQAIKLDSRNGNHKWLEAIETEVAALMSLNCFRFPSPEESE